MGIICKKWRLDMALGSQTLNSKLKLKNLDFQLGLTVKTVFKIKEYLLKQSLGYLELFILFGLGSHFD